MIDGASTTTDVRDLYARDGHLTMLTFDRFEAGELGTAQCESVITHLRDCAVCSNRLEAMGEDAVPLTAPVASPRVRHVVFGAAALSVGMAAAASLLLAVWPKPWEASRIPASGHTLSASPYTTTEPDFDNFGPAAADTPELRMRADGRRLESGERVAWEAAVEVEVEASSSGFAAVVIARSDREAEGLAEDGTGGLAPEVDVAVLRGPSALKPGERLRFSYGRAEAEPSFGAIEERVFVVWCRQRFTIEEIGLDPEYPIGIEGCSMRETTIERTASLDDT